MDAEGILTLGDHATIVPLGDGHVVSGYSTSFEDDLTGLIFKAIPPTLAGRKGGTPLSPMELEMMREASNSCQTVFLHCANPEALDQLAEQATKCAALWREHLAAQEG